MFAWGMRVDRDAGGKVMLGREGGHAAHRIIHAGGDATGAEVQQVLVERVKQTAGVRVFSNCFALDLITPNDGEGSPVMGAITHHPKFGLQMIWARSTILAAGGSGVLFRETTNPPQATADGLAMAYRAGATLADMAYMQFHPTTLYLAGASRSLITEAIRGAGAYLLDEAKNRFMLGVHPMAELAPRDVVARAVHSERDAGRGAWLDCRASVGAAFPERFPAVFSACMSAGIDPRIQPIPVAPAAHYHMGGVVTDRWGATTLAGLSACGECASTGANGANRLASNSLLESMVFGARIAERLRDAPQTPLRVGYAQAPPQLDVATLGALRERMSRDCGVVRDGTGLTGLVDWITATDRSAGGPSALTAARLIATAALQRRESRGGHWRNDHPATDPVGRRSFMVRDGQHGICFLDRDPFLPQPRPRSTNA